MLGSQGGKGRLRLFRERLDDREVVRSFLVTFLVARQVVFRSEDGFLAELSLRGPQSRIDDTLLCGLSTWLVVLSLLANTTTLSVLADSPKREAGE